ncbi:cysteine desulfurase/sulfurtransferase TusA family protein [Yinghuangia seranimata]|uniref:cysteine desulfurase/sulfurtransferase TusA family protein n=1 Tax=Yinghuangia seranimata TaxID=408067 RepID=UPI00248C16A8|nr:cysteine desulfurase/sulfurtransferase TusA family protein [Yinghuangia seranimata]MDI2126094.1 aminotransferase class V-fold PLP-dependent enzyme [Yinghuangia seranimata]
MAYFDAASAEPLHPAARAAFLSALEEGWADPARQYHDGRRARLLLDAARETVATVLGARPDEVAFTGSGTQAAQLALLGTVDARRRVGRHVVVSAVEHSSVLHAAELHEAHGGEITRTVVDRSGRIDLDALAADLRDDTAAVALQSANHEVGTLQPVAEAAELCAARGVPLVVDAAQSVGRVPVPDGWSALAASAHKWGGPAGVGVLVVRKGTRYRSPLPYDERESRRVPGFVNVPAIVAAAVALGAVATGDDEENRRLSGLVDRIRARVPEVVPDVEVVGDPVRRLPHVVTFSCLYVDGEALLTALDRAGFAVSSGSSCTSSTLTPSHVLAAMGVLTQGNVRVSLPQGTPAAEVDRFLAVLPGIVADLRAVTGTGRAAGAEQAAAPAPEAVAEDKPDDEAAGPAEPPALVVDALGRRCPIPVIELAKRIGEVPHGAVVAVLSDDEAARLDVPAWCDMTGNAYLGETPNEAGGTAYLVRRA